MKPLADSVTAQQRERFMDALARHASTVLADLKMDNDKIDVAVADMTALIAEDFAGQHIYIPTDYIHRSMERAMSIYNACNGRNHSEVARKFNCSERTVYRIYKRMRKHLISKNQHDMFSSTQ